MKGGGWHYSKRIAISTHFLRTEISLPHTPMQCYNPAFNALSHIITYGIQPFQLPWLLEIFPVIHIRCFATMRLLHCNPNWFHIPVHECFIPGYVCLGEDDIRIGTSQSCMISIRLRPSFLLCDSPLSVPMMIRIAPGVIIFFICAATMTLTSALAEEISPRTSGSSACTYTCPEMDTSGDQLVFFTPLPPYPPGEEFIC